MTLSWRSNKARLCQLERWRSCHDTFISPEEAKDRPSSTIVWNKRKQNLTGFFVRQGKDVVSDRAAWDIYVSELSGLDGGVVPFDAQSSGLRGRRVGLIECPHPPVVE
jgi:hypothetical protein